MDAKARVTHSLKIRDDSIDQAFPGLTLPDPLPTNVQGLAAGFLTEQELLITGYGPETVLEKIRTKELSCETVTRAFLRRAAIAQKAVRPDSTINETHCLLARGLTRRWVPR